MYYILHKYNDEISFSQGDDQYVNKKFHKKYNVLFLFELLYIYTW